MGKKFFLLTTILSTTAFAAVQTPFHAGSVSLLKMMIENQLAEKNPGSRIELSGNLVWSRGSLPEKIVKLQLMKEDARGIAKFRVNDSEVTVKYSAWLLAPIAVRTIRPGEQLERGMFTFQEVDISKGLARNHRGLILGTDTKFRNLETRQTIVQGAYPLLSSVRPMPVIRRGDSVQVKIRRGGLIVSTSGKALEPAPAGRNIKILTKKNKRELVGKVTPEGTVEVTL